MIAKSLLLLGTAGVLALVTACGGSSHASHGHPANAPAPQTSTVQSSPSAAATTGGGGSGGGIPQNGGGDHDGDNSGGPSDGDGSL
jgi:hypothetical protein